MPIYEYQCVACNHGLEVLQKISEEPLKECPGCGESALKKKVSAAAFRLKGGGWYETDFKTGDKKNIAGDQSSPDSSAKTPAKDSSSDASGTSSSGDGSSSKGDTSKGGTGKGSSSNNSGTGNSTATA